MTLAVLLTGAEPGAARALADGVRLTDQLGDQLRRAGARAVRHVTGLAGLAELAERADEPLLVCADDLVAHSAVLRHLATNPVPATVALVLSDPAGPGQSPVSEERGQLVAAGPGSATGAEATGTFGGALRVAVPDLPALAAAARTAAGAPAGGPLNELDTLLAALTEAGVVIFAHRVRLLVARRVTDQAGVAGAEAAVAAVDSDRAELRLSVKERDDFFTTYAVSTWSPWVTRLAARIGLGPTGVTAISVLFAVAAAVLFGVGGRPALVSGAILLYLGFMLDCVDGQLARYTRQFSPWGGWLDTIADRAKEYLVYAGLAVGVEREGLGNGWALAVAAITLQTVRHATDTWYGVLHDEAARRPKPAGTGGGGIGERLSQASTRAQADTGSLIYWAKRTVVFPIGERWALIALTVALFNPLVSLVAVLVWGALAAAYTLLLRTLRARSMRVAVLPGVDRTLHRDDGPLARLLGAAGRRGAGPAPLPLTVAAVLLAVAALLYTGYASTAPGDAGPRRLWLVAALVVAVLVAGLGAAGAHDGALDWLVPAGLRVIEYLFVISLALAAEVSGPVLFALLFALVLHHYDLTARLEKRERAPLGHRLRLGWDGRLLLLTVLVLVAGVGTVASVGMATFAGYLLVIFTVGAWVGWTAVAGVTQPLSDGAMNDPHPLAATGTAKDRNR